MDKVANQLGFDSIQPLYDGDIYQILYHLKSLPNNYISSLPYEIIDYIIDEYMYNNTHIIIFDATLINELIPSIKDNNLLYKISYKIYIFYEKAKIKHNFDILISKIPSQHNKYNLLHYICTTQLYISERPNDESLDKNR